MAEVKRCPKCGEVIERTLMFPVMDGSGRRVPRTVSVMCKCDEEKDRKRNARFEREERMRRLEDLKRLSLMDERMRNATFRSFQLNQDNEKLFVLAKKYVANFDTMKKKGQGILFYGDVGTGKSYTAAAIANELLDMMKPVIMTSFIRLLEELRKFNDEASELYVDRLNEADLLIVDDLGAERGTDFALEKVYDVVDSRYRSGRPMILTTNLEVSFMRQCTDIRYSRIYDRIFEMCYPFRTTGPSWRKRQAVSRFDEMKKLLDT